jgi:glycosyltransferase involved in cell wall biosynthesis
MNKMISVIIPTFNRETLTKRAIDSVKSRSPELVEIIVVDDFSSTPFTYGLHRNVGGIDVKVIHLMQNLGAGMARQAGVNNSKSKYIAFLDSDDFYDPEWLNHIIALLHVNNNELNSKLIICGIAAGEKLIGKGVRQILSLSPLVMQLPLIKIISVFFNPFTTPSLVLHRDICHFKSNLRYCEDYFTSVCAIFNSENIILSNKIACHLGRAPNTKGGLSSMSEKMNRGEIIVRCAILSRREVSLQYKLLAPFGILYQILRYSLKKLFKLIN